MLKLLMCSRCHIWESEDEGSLCPQCGESGELMPDPKPAEESGIAELPPPTEAPPTAPTPPVIAGYHDLKYFGPGPLGFHLYRARQRFVNREVLLEVVQARDDPKQRSWSSLRSEAGLLGKLRHAHIRGILEAGERDRQLFYNVVEWIDGPTLTDHVADAPLPVPQAVRLVELLARAVEYAQQREVLHRHLEPARVLLQPETTLEEGITCQLHAGLFSPRLVGFGLARRSVEGDATDAELYAEPGYLSPEQGWGRTKEISRATDVYGLGAILYFLLTQRAPFRGPTLGDTLDAIQTATLVPPSEFRRVPADVESVCKKALSRSTRQRYPSAAALAEELGRISRRLALSSGRTALTTLFGRWVWRG